MKLTVLIPAYNEEDTIGSVIKNIPRSLPSVTEVSVIVINDGSTDGTSRIAREAGATVYSLEKNRGLARAISFGFSKCLEHRADILVTLDADNQYDPAEISDIIRPIVDGEADIVLGDRQVGSLGHMPLQKRMGNRMSSWVVSLLMHRKINDAQTGFRAFNHHALAKMHIFSRYTYTQETLLQAGFKGLTVVEVPVEFRERRSGKSRLISNIFTYAVETILLIMSTVIFYKSTVFFGILTIVLFVLGIGFSIFLVGHLYTTGQIRPYYPTTIMTALFLITAMISALITILSSILDRHSRMQEEILRRLRRQPYGEE